MIGASSNHLFPFRTEKLKAAARTIVYGQLHAKIRHRQNNILKGFSRDRIFFLLLLIRNFIIVHAVFLSYNYALVRKAVCRVKLKETSNKTSKAKASVANKEKKPAFRAEPKTMQDLLNAYGGKVHGLTQGERIRGVVIAKEPKRLVLEIGGKSEGIVAEKAFTEALSFIRSLKIGDEVEASVIIPETPQGFSILSLRNAAENSAWRLLEAAKKENSEVVLEGLIVTSAGIMVNFNGITGFIPNSQLGREVSKNTQALIGKHFKAKVLDVDRRSNKVVFSEKEISEKENIDIIKRALAMVKEGEVYDGVVTTIYDFGCFVKINVPFEKGKIPLEGLVHISELSWDKVDRPKEKMSEGAKVKVRVIGQRDGKLALSIKQTQKDPWLEVVSKYPKDKKVEGKVSRTTDFGVFVQLEPGIEGLVHMTKIPPGMKLREGDVTNVYIEEVDASARKISLGLVLTAKPVGYK